MNFKEMIEERKLPLNLDGFIKMIEEKNIPTKEYVPKKGDIMPIVHAETDFVIVKNPYDNNELYLFPSGGGIGIAPLKKPNQQQ